MKEPFKNLQVEYQVLQQEIIKRLGDHPSLHFSFDILDLSFDPFVHLGKTCEALAKTDEVLALKREGLLYRDYARDIRPELEESLAQAKASIQQHGKLAAWNDAFITCLRGAVKNQRYHNSEIFNTLFMLITAAIGQAVKGEAFKNDIDALKAHPGLLSTFETALEELLKLTEIKNFSELPRKIRLRAQTYQPSQNAFKIMQQSLARQGWLKPSKALAWTAKRKQLVREKQRSEREAVHDTAELKEAHENAFLTYLGSCGLDKQEATLKTLPSQSEIYDKFWLGLLEYINSKYEQGGIFCRHWLTVRDNVVRAIFHLKNKAYKLNISFEQFERPLMLTEFNKILDETYGFIVNKRSIERGRQITAFKGALACTQSSIDAIRLVDDTISRIECAHAQSSIPYNINSWLRPSRAVAALEEFKRTCIENQWVESPVLREFYDIENAIKNEMEIYFSRFWFVSRSERRVLNTILETIREVRRKSEGIGQHAEQGLDTISRCISQAITKEEERYNTKASTQLLRWMGFESRSNLALALSGAATHAYEKSRNIKIYSQERKQKLIKSLEKIMQQFMDKEAGVTDKIEDFVKDILGRETTQFEKEKLEAIAHLRILIKFIKDDAYTIDLATLFVSTAADSLDMVCPNNSYFANTLREKHKHLKAAGILLASQAVATEGLAKNNALCQGFKRLKALYADKRAVKKEADQIKQKIRLRQF